MFKDHVNKLNRLVSLLLNSLLGPTTFDAATVAINCSEMFDEKGSTEKDQKRITFVSIHNGISSLLLD